MIKLKSSYATYPTCSAKSLACDTANEHARERHAAAVRQRSNGTNADYLMPIIYYLNGREHYSDS